MLLGVLLRYKKASCDYMVSRNLVTVLLDFINYYRPTSELKIFFSDGFGEVEFDWVI